MADTMKEILNFVKIKYGRINYAEIESVCREHELNMSLLAVRWTEELAKANPNIIVVNPNSPQKTCSYVAIVCETLEDVPYYADLYEIKYDPVLNRSRLAEAGMAVPKPGSNAARLKKAPLN